MKEQIIGRVIDGRWRIDQKIGEGGMGAAYLAVEMNPVGLPRHVVMKIPLSPGSHDAAFLKEARRLMEMAHPHIISVIGVGLTEFGGLEKPYLVMPFMAGGTLYHRLASQKSTLAVSEKWLSQIATALDFVASQKHVHRDVKPHNILFDDHDNAYLSDFGITSRMSTGGLIKSHSREIIGTMSYMPPEAFGVAKADFSRFDQYSLATVVYEFVSGSAPFAEIDDTIRFMYVKAHEDPPNLADIAPHFPRAAAEAVMRGLQRSAPDRFPTATEFAEAVMSGMSESSWNEQRDLTTRLLGGQPSETQQISITPFSPQSPPTQRIAGEDLREVPARKKSAMRAVLFGALLCLLPPAALAIFRPSAFSDFQSQVEQWMGRENGQGAPPIRPIRFDSIQSPTNVSKVSLKGGLPETVTALRVNFGGKDRVYDLGTTRSFDISLDLVEGDNDFVVVGMDAQRNPIGAPHAIKVTLDTKSPRVRCMTDSLPAQRTVRSCDLKALPALAMNYKVDEAGCRLRIAGGSEVGIPDTGDFAVTIDVAAGHLETEFEVIDAAGNTTGKSIAVAPYDIDDRKPEIRDLPETMVSDERSIDISFAVDESCVRAKAYDRTNPGNPIELKLESEERVVGRIDLPDRDSEWTIVVRDVAGNESERVLPIRFSPDNRAPVLKVVGFPEYSNSPTISWTASVDEPNCTVIWKVDEGPETSRDLDKNRKCPVTSDFTVDGVKQIVVWAKDKKGNPSEKITLSVTIDTKRPTIRDVSVKTPSREGNFEVERIVVTVRCDEADANVDIVPAPLKFSNHGDHFEAELSLSMGQNHFSFVACDPAGNKSEPTPMVFVRVDEDRRAPVIELTSEIPSRVRQRKQLLIEGSVDEDGCRVWFERAGNRQDARMKSKRHFTSPTINLGYGDNTITVAAEDARGNPAHPVTFEIFFCDKCDDDHQMDCPKCDPSGTVRCPNDCNRGYVDCGANGCEGGTITIICRRCGGSGREPFNPYWLCANCRGQCVETVDCARCVGGRTRCSERCDKGRVPCDNECDDGKIQCNMHR